MRETQYSVPHALVFTCNGQMVADSQPRGSDHGHQAMAALRAEIRARQNQRGAGFVRLSVSKRERNLEHENGL